MGFEMHSIYHHNHDTEGFIFQKYSFMLLLCSQSLLPPLTLILYLYSFTFSRTSYKWNHKVCRYAERQVVNVEKKWSSPYLFKFRNWNAFTKWEEKEN